MTRKMLFGALVLLQVLFLLVVAGSYYGVDQFGKEIRLKTVPVDPRDLFYGDYVVLNYEISTLNNSLWKGRELPEMGDPIYVVLAGEGDRYHAVSAHPSKPDVSAGQLVLRGTYDYSPIPETMRISYGIERYYVPEGQGHQIEDLTRNGNATVVLKIAPWGQIKITDLELPNR